MSKYLILKLGALGDISFFLPAVDQIKRYDAQAHVTWIVGSAYVDFLEKHPGIDQIISVDEKRLFHGSAFQKLREGLRLWLRLGFFYHRILIGHRTLGAFLLVRLRVLGRIFQVVRQPSFWNSRGRTEVVIPPLCLHESLGFKQLLEKALDQSIARESWKWSTHWIPSPLKLEGTPYVCFHLGGGSNAKTEFRLKKWPGWSEFLKLFLKNTQMSVVLVGAPSERAEAEELVREIEREIRSERFRVDNQVGQTKMIELVSLLKSATCFVGVDSGPLHFADSMDVPCVGIYGPTSSVSWGLLGARTRVFQNSVPCSPCYRDDGIFPECTHEHVCMKALAPSGLMKVLEEFMGEFS